MSAAKRPLLEAIRRCWASLWTARAIGYRQDGIDQQTVAMGVVVQNGAGGCLGHPLHGQPASGDRSEFVVNASFGLGEAVVGGHVTPDTYVLDRTSLEIKETIIGGKEQMIVSAAGQGTTTLAVPEPQRDEPSLSPEDLSGTRLTECAVEAAFDGLPQDIEWAVAEGNLLAAAITAHHQSASTSADRMFLGTRPRRNQIDPAAGRREHARTALAVVRRLYLRSRLGARQSTSSWSTSACDSMSTRFWNVPCF